MSLETQKVLLKQLKNPFDEKFVKFRVGATNSDKTKGIALAYIDSREVTKRLDDVCGIGGWQAKYVPLDGGLICELSILIDGTWVTKSNAAGYTKVEAIKGGASDALKRAAATWGVGRYLYYLPNAWVAIKQQGKNSRGDPIYVLAETPELPDWARNDKNVERWEDVAELEADSDSGADVVEEMFVSMVVDNVDRIRAATTIEELDAVVEAMPGGENVILANQINAKRRELLHEANIHADSGTSPTA